MTHFLNGQDPAAAAAGYILGGHRVVPLPFGSKAPAIKEWPTLRITEADLSAYFPAGAHLNIGLLNGAPSGGLIDVDLDCPEAVAAGSHFLPVTRWVSGRPSAPRSHRWYSRRQWRTTYSPSAMARATWARLPGYARAIRPK